MLKDKGTGKTKTIVGKNTERQRSCWITLRRPKRSQRTGSGGELWWSPHERQSDLSMAISEDNSYFKFANKPTASEKNREEERGEQAKGSWAFPFRASPLCLNCLEEQLLPYCSLQCLAFSMDLRTKIYAIAEI